MNSVTFFEGEGPVLFLFIMQAALETMKWPVPKPEFCTRENGVTMGERTERNRGTTKHEHGCSLYADDAVFFFSTREDLEKGASCLYAHLLQFGLTMHIVVFGSLHAQQLHGFDELRHDQGIFQNRSVKPDKMAESLYLLLPHSSFRFLRLTKKIE
jgi:hypothetical protein